MAKYPIMRDNGSSTYFAERFDGAEQAATGYSLCVLRAGRRAEQQVLRSLLAGSLARAEQR
jgi:hypothetical protein